MADYITVSKAEDNQRLARFLQKKFPNVSYAIWQKFFRKKEFKINGTQALKDSFVYEHDVIRIPPLHFLQTANEAPKKTTIDSDEAQHHLQQMILDEQPGFIVINKPAKLAVQGGTNTTYHIDALLMAVQAITPYFLVHRLDKETSGVMLIAKGRDNARLLSEDFKQKKITKIYDALCAHYPHKKQKGCIIEPLKELHEKMMVRDDGVYAETKWWLQQEYAHHCWLKLQPITGRKHQLRAHLAFANCPIMGDKKYGTRDVEAHIEPQQYLQLHARTITLPNGYQIKAPRPDYMNSLIPPQ